MDNSVSLKHMTRFCASATVQTNAVFYFAAPCVGHLPVFIHDLCPLMEHFCPCRYAGSDGRGSRHRCDVLPDIHPQPSPRAEKKARSSTRTFLVQFALPPTQATEAGREL